MKKTVLNILIVSSFVLALSSCKTYSHTSRIVDVRNQDVVSEKFVVDVEPDFNNRLKGSSTKTHTDEKSAKEEAYFNAIIDNKIDVLVNPIYSVSSTKKLLFFFGGKSEATVYGYAGYYKNPRSASEARQQNFDSKLSNLSKLSKVEGVQQEVEEKTYTMNPTCGDCKGNDAVTLISITKNKESLVDVYGKLTKDDSYNIGNKSLSKNSSTVTASKNQSIVSKIIGKIKGIFIK